MTWIQIAPKFRRDARDDGSARAAYMRAETMRRWLLRDDIADGEWRKSALSDGELGHYEGVRIAQAHYEPIAVERPSALNRPHYHHLRSRIGRRRRA